MSHYEDSSLIPDPNTIKRATEFTANVEALHSMIVMKRRQSNAAEVRERINSYKLQLAKVRKELGKLSKSASQLFAPRRYELKEMLAELIEIDKVTETHFELLKANKPSSSPAKFIVNEYRSRFPKIKLDEIVSRVNHSFQKIGLSSFEGDESSTNQIYQEKLENLIHTALKEIGRKKSGSSYPKFP